MVKNKFTRLIDIKEKQKKEIERALKRERDNLKAEKEKLKSMKNELNSMTNLISEETVSSNIELYYSYLHILSKKIEEKEDSLKKIDCIIKSKERELLEAHIETKALKIVNSDALKDELRKVILNEQKSLDFEFLARKYKK